MYKKIKLCIVALFLSAIMNACGNNRSLSEQDISEAVKEAGITSTAINIISDQTEPDVGYKVENDEVIVYGIHYEKEDVYNFDTDEEKMKDGDVDVIKKGIVPPFIKVEDSVKKMVIKKGCRFVWERNDSCHEEPFFSNNLRGCKKLEKVNVEKGNPSVFAKEGILYKVNRGENCIYACPMKKKGEIQILNDVKNIWACAFYGCSEITSVTISDSVRGIGNGAFGNTTNCKKIKVSKDNPYYLSQNGVVYTKNKKVLVAFPAGKRMKKFKVPDGVEYIAEGAFAGVTHVKNIVLPKSVREICNGAFLSCRKFESIIARGNIKEIGTYAFYRTPEPVHMNIPRKKGKNGEYSTEWREIVDKGSLKRDFSWVNGYGN